MDPRKEGLKKGLRQLTVVQLQRLLDYKGEMVLDDCNYKDGKFCPLAIALGLDTIDNPSDEKLVQIMEEMGFSIYNTRGLKGSFYTANRKEDLLQATKEVLFEAKL
jgi:hypothetical protein